MPNDAFTQQALAKDARFQVRLQNALSRVAWEVLEEDPATPHHGERTVYAQRVLGSFGTTAGSLSATSAAQLAPSFVNRPNVFSFETSYSFEALAVITAAGDLDIESQLRTDWNVMAGVLDEAPPA
jgi:hypothetical protein